MLARLASSLPRRRIAAVPAAAYIKNICLESRCDDDDERLTLTSVLCQTPNLVSLTGLEGGFRELAALASSCANTLHKLEFKVMEGENISDALAVLQQFTCLHHLSFNVVDECDYEEVDTMELADIQYLDAPLLRYLSIGGSHAQSTTYFSRCRFPSLTQLHVYKLLEDEDRDTLDDFLHHHGPRLEWLRLDVFDYPSIPTNMLGTLRDVVFAADDWDIEKPWPVDVWFKYFPPSVLHVHLLTVYVPHPEYYFGFIDELVHAGGTVGFKFLHLDEADFSWKELYERYSKVAGSWVRFALHLKSETGITLLDKDGLTWMMLRPE